MAEHGTNPGPGRCGIILAYFLIYFVWGSTYYFIGVALDGLPPFLLGGLRFCSAGLLLLALCRIRGEAIFRGSLIRQSAISGIVLLFIDMAVIMLAQKYLSSSLVAIMASSTAIWIMALDVPMWKRNFAHPAVVAGILAGFLGVIFLFVEQFTHGSPGLQDGYGLALLVFGCISWALGSLHAKYRSSREEKINNFAGAAWQMLFAGAMFWICSLSIKEMEDIHWQDVSATVWLSLAYLVTFGSVLAYTSYIWLLKTRPAAEVGTHAYVNPCVAVVLGCFLGDETITWFQLAGLAVILSSIALIGKTPTLCREHSGK